jgi:hypothetical protein
VSRSQSWDGYQQPALFEKGDDLAQRRRQAVARAADMDLNARAGCVEGDQGEDPGARDQDASWSSKTVATSSCSLRAGSIGIADPSCRSRASHSRTRE